MSGEDKWAKVPESLIVGRLPGMKPGDRRHAGCIALYAALDLEQGKSGDPAKNLTRLAEQLGYQPRTIATWAELLADAGLIEITRKGTAAATLRLLHNPARVVDETSPLPRARRDAAPKAGDRWGHRGKRSKREVPHVARNTREAPPANAREKRDNFRAKDARTPEAPPREKRRGVQVSEGLSRSDDRSRARADTKTEEAVSPMTTKKQPDFAQQFKTLALDPDRAIEQEAELHNRRPMDGGAWEHMTFAQFRAQAALLRQSRLPVDNDKGRA